MLSSLPTARRNLLLLLPRPRRPKANCSKPGGINHEHAPASTAGIISTEHGPPQSGDEQVLLVAALRVVLNEDSRYSAASTAAASAATSAGDSCNHRVYRPRLAKQLQVVSLSVCKECRIIAAFHMRVGAGTPRRILGTSSLCSSVKRRDTNSTQAVRRINSRLEESSRIPRLRISSITWERGAEELGNGYEVRIVQRYCRISNDRWRLGGLDSNSTKVKTTRSKQSGFDFGQIYPFFFLGGFLTSVVEKLKL